MHVLYRTMPAKTDFANNQDVLLQILDQLDALVGSTPDTKKGNDISDIDAAFVALRCLFQNSRTMTVICVAPS